MDFRTLNAVRRIHIDEKVEPIVIAIHPGVPRNERSQTVKLFVASDDSRNGVCYALRTPRCSAVSYGRIILGRKFNVR